MKTLSDIYKKHRNLILTIVAFVAYAPMIPMMIDYFLFDDRVQGDRMHQFSLQDREYSYENENKLISNSNRIFTGMKQFITSIMDGRDDIEQNRRHLVQLLLEQHHYVIWYEKSLNAEGANAAKQYIATLAEVTKEAEHAKDIISLSDFWKATNDMFIAEQMLQKELRRQLGQQNG